MRKYYRTASALRGAVKLKIRNRVLGRLRWYMTPVTSGSYVNWYQVSNKPIDLSSIEIFPLPENPSIDKDPQP